MAGPLFDLKECGAANLCAELRSAGQTRASAPTRFGVTDAEFGLTLHGAGMSQGPTTYGQRPIADD